MDWDQARSLQADGDGWTAEVPADWAQGRACFGGLVTAYALQATAALGVTAPTRSVAADLLAPLAPGPCKVRAAVLREGKHLVHARAEITQAGQRCATVLQVAGASRQTALSWAPEPAPRAPSPESLSSLPYLPGRMPAFLQHVELRWTEGGAPYSRAPTPLVGGWVRLRDPGPVDVAALLALIDAWPPPVVTMMDRPAAASTVTWQVNLAQPDPAGDRSDWWLFRSEAVSSRDGYADVRASLWSRAGALVASSTQLVAEFSAP